MLKRQGVKALASSNLADSARIKMTLSKVFFVERSRRHELLHVYARFEDPEHVVLNNNLKLREGCTDPVMIEKSTRGLADSANTTPV